MAKSDGFKRYVEAGALLGQVTRARAEEIVRELVNAGDLQREQAQRWVDDLVERSRRASEDLVGLIRTEVSAQLTALGLDPDDLAAQAAELLRHSADVGRAATVSAAGRLTGRGGGERTPKTAGRKTTGRKAAGRKAAATRAARASGAGTAAKRSAGGATKASAAAPAKKAAKKSTKKAARTSTVAKRSAASKKATGAAKASGARKAAPRKRAARQGSSGTAGGAGTSSSGS